MEFKRKALNKLHSWKENPSRRPLLIRGARQVGKTTLVRTFSRSFSSYIELNLEKASHKKIFELEDVKKILNAAALLKGITLNTKSTLLFIDEIQESPEAIKLLRYFYEETPGIFVIAAGSLLEFAMKKVPNFPVGRINYLYLHPVNFPEYLMAENNPVAVEALNTIPVRDYSHDILLRLFHEYTLIGGMPEITLNMENYTG